jgi:hypothetical protein
MTNRAIKIDTMNIAALNMAFAVTGHVLHQILMIQLSMVASWLLIALYALCIAIAGIWIYIGRVPRAAQNRLQSIDGLSSLNVPRMIATCTLVLITSAILVNHGATLTASSYAVAFFLSVISARMIVSMNSGRI